MADNAKRTTSTVIPTLRYDDARAAVYWLCEAFGFERHLVVPGENGTITHAQLVFGNGMIMLGSARDNEFGQLQKPPRASGGVGSQSPYIIAVPLLVVWEKGARRRRRRRRGEDLCASDCGPEGCGFELCRGY